MGRCRHGIAGEDNTFTKRTVGIGMQQNGYDQITEGLNSGERVVIEGAIFLSNMLAGSATD